MRSRELRQKLGELIHRYRELLDATPADQRSAEDVAVLDSLDREMNTIELEISRVDKQEARELELHRVVGPRETFASESPAPLPEERVRSREQRAREWEQRYGPRGREIANLADGLPSATPEYRAAFAHWLMAGNRALAPDEQRALSMGVSSEGGYLVPTEEFILELLKGVDDQSVIRQLARTFTVTTAQAIGAPALASDPADADWTTEIGTVAADTEMAFGKREMRPWPVRKLELVSDKLLRAGPLNVETLVRERLSYKVGITHAKAFNTGSGASQPLGAYVPSADGIPTSRDVEIGNGSGAVDPDKLIAARYQLKAGYSSRPSTRWHMHRNWLAKFRALKGTNGQYLWQPGLADGVPSTFLEIPFVIDEYAPSVTTHGAGVYAAILGDWSNYWIVDALSVRVKRLDELYAASGQVGFIAAAETDGAPVLAEAFVRLIAAT